MPPDIVLLGVEWQPRALLRAQLIEEGFEVLATDDWTTMRESLRPGSEPWLAIVDLQGLPQPDRVLADLRVLMKPGRVLVLTALGAVPRDQIERFGFRMVHRPIQIAEVVATAARAIREGRTDDYRPGSA
jgi:DNA-binding response OmpR family regulator